MGTGCPRGRWLGRWLGRLLTAALLEVVTALTASARSPAIAPATVPAKDRQEAILTVSEFGRYSITVASQQGTALQLVDRLSGPSKIEGAAGSADGRLDLFLDRGTYKVLTHAHARGAGTAQLKVRPFSERNGPTPPLLVELKPVGGSLDDLEQRSFWLDVPARRRVVLEAAGRNLADLRLWSNGDWLVDATPACSVAQPRPGRPLLICRLTADLNPGLYLLTAYGGPSQPWAIEGKEHPFHLRFGIPTRAEVARSRHVVSPFGIDRWIVPGNASYFRIELPEARPAELGLRPFTSEAQLDPPTSRAAIEKSSLLPVAELEVERGAHIVTVAASAGQPYILQHFDYGRPYFCGGRYWELGEQGTYWISTIHSGDPSDSIDATALLIRRHRWRAEGPRIEPFAAQVIDLGAGVTWARRCNVLDPFSAFLSIRTTGKYEILSRGVDARFRIEPFLIYPPEHYQPPPRQRSPSTWDLDAGYYVLTAEPEKRGIVDLVVRSADQPEADPFARLRGAAREAGLRELRAAAQFPRITIDHDYAYSLFINEQPEVKVGMVLRRLPLDPTQPLPVMQYPGEQVTVPFVLSEPGTIRAEAEDGTLLPVSVDGGSPQTAPGVDKGTHQVTIEHPGEQRVHYALSVEPLRLQSTTALPPLPDPQRARPPRLPVLSRTAAQFLDLDRAASATYLVSADRPALYRLQSTGLLFTEGNLRTRTLPSFVRRSANGVGRNFYIDQYLREGDYQITVTAQGASKGHLGLTLEQTAMIEGGVIAEGAPGRLTLPAGAAVRYRFTIGEAGDYRVRSIGVATTFRCRLEDADGWPITAPNLTADVTRRFEPGTYQIVSMPEPVASRRLTVLEHIPPPVERKGHGPHPLPLDQRLEHVWMEPEPGGERTPDAWQLSVPAAVDVRVDLTDEMQGRFVHEDGGGVVADIPPGRGWQGTLEAGRYRLEATCGRVNNRVPYTVAVWPRQLVAGLDRAVSIPADVPLAVGSEGLVQLSSFGSVDVKARLYDAQDRLIASNDDAPDDWNFQLQVRLDPGRYRLRVDRGGAGPLAIVGSTPTPTPSPAESETQEGEEAEDEAPSEDASAETAEEAANEQPRATADDTASTIVSLRAPAEETRPTLALPAAFTVETGRSIALYPIQRGQRDELLLVSVQAADSVGCAVETTDERSGRWRVVGQDVSRRARVIVPLSSGGQYRLRLWSPDGRQTAAHLRVVATMPPRVNEKELRAGAALAPVAKLEPPMGAVALRPERPGTFRIGSAHDLVATTAPDVAATEPANGLVSASGPLTWLIGDLGKSRAAKRVKGTRVSVPAGGERSLQLEVSAETPALCDFTKTDTGIVLAVATSTAGQPGVRIVNATSDAPQPDGGTMAAGPAAAVAVGLNVAQPAALIWQAVPGAPVDVRVRQLSFSSPQMEPGAWGTSSGAIAGVAARAFDLPTGAKRLRLSLAASTVAALSSAGAITSVHWHRDEPFDETLDTTADRLTLLHTREGTDPFQVEVLPVASAETVALGVGHPFERAVASAGHLYVPIDAVATNPERPAVLHVRGATDDTQLIGFDGRIVRGLDLPLSATGGSVRIAHQPGLVLAWIDRRGEESAALWGSMPPAPERETPLPALLELSGTTQSVRIAPSGPVLLQARSATPVVTLLQIGEGPPQAQIHPGGCVLDAYITEPVQLAFRAAGASTLWGTATITSIPVTPIREGLGPEVLLAAGSSRLFSFEVTREGQVGVGVRANPDVATCALLDSAGKELGSGVIHMQSLQPGTYLLALRAPADAGPVRAQPAVAGIELPSTGPPEDVVRQYLTLAGTPIGAKVPQ